MFRLDDTDPLSRGWRALARSGWVVPLMLLGAVLLVLTGRNDHKPVQEQLGGFVFLGAVLYGTRARA